jgi:hypothetical protein
MRSVMMLLVGAAAGVVVSRARAGRTGDHHAAGEPGDVLPRGALLIKLRPRPLDPAIPAFVLEEPPHRLSA